MNCNAFEPLIALYVGADLPDRDRPQVEQHLAACPDCQRLLEDLQASQTALRELGSEAVDAAMLTAVRAGVLAGIGERRRRVWPWVAAFTAALLTALIVTPRKPIEQLPPPVVARILPPTSVVQTPMPPPRRRQVVRRRPAPPPAEAQPLVVKMLTDDPDIVIIWLVDQRGE
jgi:anti-sigma factor RsiW